MNILFAASESVPFCKTGGLADVVGALSSVLAKKRHSAAVVLPLYRQIKDGPFALTNTRKRVTVPLGSARETVEIWTAKAAANLTVYFVGADAYYDRDGIYGERPTVDFPDNDRRYILYSRAVLEIAKAVRFRPDVVHCHDWQTGLIPGYLKTLYARDPFFASAASVFTIHNMAYQGNFSPATFGLTGLPAREFSPKGIEFYGRVSFLKAGLIYADAVNTVSPTYAKEISTDWRFGCGLEGVLKDRGGRFRGITNGLDVQFWNPKRDELLAHGFDAATLAKRADCKKDLQRTAGLKIGAATPLLGFIGRLDPQKGIDTLLQVAPAALAHGAQLVTLGVGTPHYVAALRELRQRFPSQVFVETDFAEPFAHKIYGGVDLFLMPSAYEPCGLGQLIAMRYGAIPVVSPTGGLLDTVVDTVRREDGTGFVADDMSAGSFGAATAAALQALKDKKAWTALQKRAMSVDHSWKASAAAYIDFYNSARKS